MHLTYQNTFSVLKKLKLADDMNGLERVCFTKDIEKHRKREVICRDREN